MFSNGPQLMAKRIMANLQSTLHSTYKIRISIFGRWGPHWHSLHKYKLFIPGLLPRNILKLLPKLIAVHTYQIWKQKWHVPVVIPRMHCNVTQDVRFLLGRLVHTTTCYPTHKNAFKKFYQSWGVHSTTFQSARLELKDLHWYLLWGFLQY